MSWRVIKISAYSVFASFWLGFVGILGSLLFDYVLYSLGTDVFSLFPWLPDECTLCFYFGLFAIAWMWFVFVVGPIILLAMTAYFFHKHPRKETHSDNWDYSRKEHAYN